jgi:hypothetical protein
LASTLWHPHIVGVHGRGESEGQLWVSMDFVDGLDAARLLAQRYPGRYAPAAIVLGLRRSRPPSQEHVSAIMAFDRMVSPADREPRDSPRMMDNCGYPRKTSPFSSDESLSWLTVGHRAGAVAAEKP